MRGFSAKLDGVLSQEAMGDKPNCERRHMRVPARLKGRGLLADGTEFELETVDVSAGGMCIEAGVRPQLGQRIVVYLELIGGLQGEIVRLTPEGFGMSFRATVRKRDKIADQLTWLMNRDMLGEDGQRRSDRIEPRKKNYRMIMEGGEADIVIVDVSRSGAAVLCAQRPAHGDWVTIGKTRARVVRAFPGGFAVEFARVIPIEIFDPDVAL